MSQTIAELDRAAAAYWWRLARVDGQNAGAAQEIARRLAAEAQAQARAPEADARHSLQRRLR